ncbi:MAG TPA: endo-1,4-beta-xylanase, partial [Polyangiaceae bacterium]|nr:endo-1,4-beta-xylanase [Polyangiaceae bacterium]
MTVLSPRTAISTLARCVPALAACLLTTPAHATDLPVIASFDDGSSPFWDYASEGNTQTFEVTADGKFCITVEPTTNPDEADPTKLKKVNPWDHIQGISEIALTLEQYYRVSFSASFTPADPAADPAATREIRFKTGLGEDPYTDYYLAKLQLTSTPQVVDITFRNLREDPIAQAQFQLGGTPGVVCLDDFVLEAVAAPAPVTYTTTSTSGRPLKDYSAMVKLGTAVDTPIFLSSPLHNAIVAAEFAAITPANAMKMNVIQPVRGRFDFVDADALYAFAQQNGLEFRGHPLVWHTQAANWLEEEGVDRDTTLAIMYEHMDGLMGHFPDLPYWDVVNEAIER